MVKVLVSPSDIPQIAVPVPCPGYHADVSLLDSEIVDWHSGQITVDHAGKGPNFRDHPVLRGKRIASPSIFTISAINQGRVITVWAG